MGKVYVFDHPLIQHKVSLMRRKETNVKEFRELAKEVAMLMGFIIFPSITSFGLTDALQHKRPDLSDEPETMKFTNSLKKVTQQMVVLSFYFE